MFTNQFFAPTSKNIDRNNKWFAFFFTAGFGIFGSVLTVMIGCSSLIILALQFLGKIRLSANREIWHVALFFLIFFLVSSAMAFVHYDDGKNLKIIINRLPFLAFFPLAMAFTYSKREHMVKYLEVGSAVGCAIASIFVFYQISSGIGSAEGASGNPNPFTVSIFIAYVFCLFGLIKSQHKKYSLLMMLGISSALFCIAVAGTRGTLPLILVLPAIAIFGFKEVIFYKVLLPILILLGFAMMLTLAIRGEYIAGHFVDVQNNFEAILRSGNFGSSLGERFVMWDYALQNIPKNIWFGIGQFQTQEGLSQFMENEYELVRYSYSHLHNFIINAQMRGGILELSATIALLVGPIIVAMKFSKDSMGVYGTLLMVSIVLIYTTSGIFNITFGHDIQDSLYTYMMAMAAWLVFDRPVELPNTNSNIPHGKNSKHE